MNEISAFIRNDARTFSSLAILPLLLLPLSDLYHMKKQQEDNLPHALVAGQRKIKPEPCFYCELWGRNVLLSFGACMQQNHLARQGMFIGTIAR